MARSGEHGAAHAVDARSMRLANLSLTLGAIVRHAPVSQSMLADLTGLKKPTVSNLVDELGRLGLVRVEGAAPSKVGRPPRLLAPNPHRGFVLVAHVSVDRIAALVVDFAGDECARGGVAVDVGRIDQSAAIREIAALCLAVLTDAGAPPDDVLGTALAVPGIVGAHGDLSYVPGLTWDRADVGAMLRTALADALPAAAPLLVENEAKLAALAEQRAGMDVRNFVFLLGGVGVGAGVILEGSLFRGTRGAAGEIGHLSVTVDGARCSCGKRGCWALYVSREALLTEARARRASGRVSTLWERNDGDATVDEPLTPERILAAARAGDAVAVEALDQLRRHLAVGIGNIASAYDTEVVVLGGFLATAFGQDLDAVRSEVASWLMGELHDGLRVELATHGDDAPLWGGVALVTRHLVARPRTIAPPGSAG